VTNIDTKITLREEEVGDVSAIRTVESSAFDTDAESKLVDGLREAGGLTLSLVAESDGAIVGHIAFSPATIHDGDTTHAAVGLAPMAVIPDRQRAGIGSLLVREGLRRLQAGGHRHVIVLGHPTYYPKFGFVSARPHGVSCEYDVPDDTFMILALGDASMDEVRGTARYHAEFGRL